jgi:hypothetical protein
MVIIQPLMKIILRITLLITAMLCLSSCQLINMALRLLPYALMLVEDDPAAKKSQQGIEARAGQIQSAPTYKGRLDWAKQPSTGQAVVSR